MKICIRCRDPRNKKFQPHGKYLSSYCTVCENEISRLRRKTPKGKATAAWYDINKRLRHQPEYKHIRLEMSKEDFIAWATPRFEDWFKNRPNDRPSIDRINPKDHYRIGNLRILELGENSRQRGNAVNVHAPEGKLWCNECNQYKDKDLFHKNKNHWTGYQKKCRECRSKINLAK